MLFFILSAFESCFIYHFMAITPTTMPFIIFFVGFLFVINVAVCMRLGEKGQLVLTKKIRYWIREERHDYIWADHETRRGIYFHKMYLAETRTDTKELVPYLIVEYYNSPWWLRLLTLNNSRARTKIIKYIPSEDEV